MRALPTRPRLNFILRLQDLIVYERQRHRIAVLMGSGRRPFASAKRARRALTPRYP